MSLFDSQKVSKLKLAQRVSTLEEQMEEIINPSSIGTFGYLQVGGEDTLRVSPDDGVKGKLVPISGSAPSILGWQMDLTFSSSDLDTVAWTSGTITLAEETTYAIEAGNTGNMAARTYIYLDTGVSLTVLQTTTTAGTAVGANKILLASAINSTNEALFFVFGGSGGVNLAGGNLETETITANEIATDAIEEAKILASAVTAGKTSIAAINAVDGNLNSNAVGSAQLQTNAVTEDKVLADAITATKLAVSGLDGATGDVVADHIVANMIQTNAITSVKVNAGAVTANKLTTYNFILSAGSFANNSPGAGSVAWTDCKVVYNGTESSITNGNTANKFIYWQSASPTVFATSASLPSLGDSDFIVAENLSGTHLLVWNSTVVDGGRVRTGSVTATQIQASTITANEIAGTTITGDKIAADAITALKIDVVGLDGTTGRIVVTDATDADMVTGGINSHATTLIQAGKIVISGATNLDDWRNATDTTKIDGGNIYTNTITATQINAGTITATEILANTITANEMAANSVTATEINVANLAAISANMGSITAGTVTGAIVQSAATGVRTKTDSTNGYQFYTDATLKGKILADTTAGIIYDTRGSSHFFRNNTTEYAQINNDGLLLPANHSITFSGGSTLTDDGDELRIDRQTRVNGVLYPNGDANKNLGATDKRWDNCYLQKIHSSELEGDNMTSEYNPSNAGNDCFWESVGNRRMKCNQGGHLSIDGAYTDGGADFAEMFESTNGKAIPDGTSVVLIEDKIRKAEKNEQPIGVISANPTIIGNASGADADSCWTGKYLKDDFGNYIMEKAEWWQSKEKSGWTDEKKAPKKAKKRLVERRKTNPKWNKEEKYIPREDRPEWNVVGLLGRVKITKGQPIANSWIKLHKISNTVTEYLIK